MTDSASSPEAPTWSYQGYHLDPGNFTAAMAHLYRAEVSRANLWRNRLDTTTNWAVVTTAAALTFSFGSPQNPHFVLLLVLLLVFTFLHIEARRYSYYALWYYRVRLLETEFFGAMMAPPYQPSADWGASLSQTLSNPTFPIHHWRALGNRYRRNYIWLVTLLLLSWVLKLSLHPTVISDPLALVQRAAVGEFVRGPLVMGVVVGVYVGMLFITMAASTAAGPQGSAPNRSKHRRSPREFLRPQERLAIIITDAREATAKHLMNYLGRGVTSLSGTGMYTGEPRNVLLCALTDVQIKPMREIVSEHDPNAFVVVTEASDIRGGGFRPFEPPS